MLSPKYEFESANYESSTNLRAQVSVTLIVDGLKRTEVGYHNGETTSASITEAMQDAVYKITGLKPKINSIWGETRGRERQARQWVRLEQKDKAGKRIICYSDYNRGTDCFQAEVAAYIETINVMVRIKQ